MPYLSKRKIVVRSNKHEVNERRNKKWGKYYGDRRYTRLRDWYMSEHVLCQDCLFEGRSVPATELHHIKPFSRGKTEEERMELLLDWEHNYVALCKSCHEKRHKMLNQQNM